VDPDRVAIANRLAGVQRVLFVVANKGGCGKSSVKRLVPLGRTQLWTQIAWL
jgi:Mrp family chromosome partitioning ATPase